MEGFKLRRLLSLLAATCLLVAVAGCGGSGTPPTSGSSGDVVPPDSSAGNQLAGTGSQGATPPAGGLPRVWAIAAGYDHSLVLLENGDVYVFGANNFGQLGLGDKTMDKYFPGTYCCRGTH